MLSSKETSLSAERIETEFARSSYFWNIKLNRKEMNLRSSQINKQLFTNWRRSLHKKNETFRCKRGYKSNISNLDQKILKKERMEIRNVWKRQR